MPDSYNLSDTLNHRLRHWSRRPAAMVRRVAAEFRRLLHPEEPWISHHAVKFCKEHLNPRMRGLEWGSGRSTAWYAKRLGALCSVEHSPVWHETVRKMLEQRNVTNVDYRHVALDHPEHAPTEKTYATLPSYVAVVNGFADGSLDFVVVDGHYRQACIGAVLKKLSAGGLLLVDNTEWMKLADWGVPDSWPVVHRSQGLEGETTIWRKP